MILSGFPVLTVVAQQSNHPRDLGVVGCHGASISKSAQDFEWIETEATRDTKASGLVLPEGGAKGLRCVLDDCDSVFLRNRQDAVHLTHASIQMDWQKSFSPRCDPGIYKVGIHIVVVPDIHQDWRRPTVHNRRNRCYESVANGDHLIARAHACSQQ